MFIVVFGKSAALFKNTFFSRRRKYPELLTPHLATSKAVRNCLQNKSLSRTHSYINNHEVTQVTNSIKIIKNGCKSALRNNNDRMTQILLQ